ncbi:MAG: NADH-quinone oxidoreductase subunit K [Caldilineaceae bacterium]|nr:NADH-quinone oxidoreductase subunit K [Caldilineaceae bacterium]MBP8109875.1 NADH-quinone oxidoreductase subunit K [Caldilineaceae bacterium]MBP8122505.1 NADH-quinone oxidoreductase subunit K [Caldilineaceae bacterium]MBP9072958.1 NADH-quinone oxidoreductase subunit K [Caldilineaceae bacterium]
MTGYLLAVVVGALFMGGTYLILRRGEIKLILGLALLSHGVNLLLFGTGTLKRGIPPILDKSQILGDISAYPDPLPQALILTAIVISFGITAFVIVLVNRRMELVYGTGKGRRLMPDQNHDGFADTPDYYTRGLDESEDDFVFLDYPRTHPADKNPGAGEPS